VVPPDKVKAEFELPEDKRLVVLVEDPAGLANETALKMELTRELNRELEDRGLVHRAIPYRRLMSFAAATPNFRSMSSVEVAKKLGVDLVLYVKIDDFQLRDDPNSHFWHGKLETLVRVISAEHGRLWPKDLPNGYPPPKVDTGSVPGNPTQKFEASFVHKMALEMTDNIAKLFYKHRGKPHGSLPQDEMASPP
jgi:hypothetical protein